MREDHPYESIHQKNLEAILSSPDYQELMNLNSQDKAPRQCHTCVVHEQMGVESERMRISNYHPYFDMNSPHIEILELRMDSLCNLSCRTCSTDFSTGWNLDSLLLGKIKNPIRFQPYASLEQIKSILTPLLPHLRAIRFIGGETFLSPLFTPVMEWIELVRKDLTLEIFSNLSGPIKLKQKLESLSEFKQVILLASLDGIDKRCEYIRNGLKWEEVLHNLDSISAFSNLQFIVMPLMSIFNVLHVTEILKYWHDRTDIKKTLRLQFLEDVSYYDIASLTPEQKKKVISTYNQFLNSSDPDLKDFSSPYLHLIISHLKARDRSFERATFAKVTKALDQLRGQDFSKTFPELVDLEVLMPTPSL